MYLGTGPPICQARRSGSSANDGSLGSARRFHSIRRTSKLKARFGADCATWLPQLAAGAGRALVKPVDSAHQPHHRSALRAVEFLRLHIFYRIIKSLQAGRIFRKFEDAVRNRQPLIVGLGGTLV